MISVIIPVYNNEETIERCISSIINQTYKNIEIIVIDDGSIDKSWTNINKINYKNIQKVKTKNCGVSHARNLGLKLAKGKYIMFCDADDYFINNNCMKELINLSDNKKIDIIRFNGEIEDDKGKKREIDFPVKNEKILCSNKDKNEIIDITCNYKKNEIRCYTPLLFIKNEKIVQFRENYKYLEDKVFYLENFLNENKKILFIDNIYYLYCYNKKSTTKDCKNLLNKIIELLKTEDYVIEIANKENYKDITAIRQTYSVLILYRMDNFVKDEINIKKLNKEIRIICKNKYIKKQLLLLKDCKVNIIKRIQAKLLLKNKVTLYIIITKVKNKIRNRG